jgi:hypothetical protein
MRLHPTCLLYPRFATYVLKEMPKVADVGDIYRNFYRCTGFTKGQLAVFLSLGFDPFLKVEASVQIPLRLPLLGEATFSTGDKGVHFTDYVPDYIVFPAATAQAFEAGTDLVQARAGQVHLAEVTLLGMLVIWAIGDRGPGGRVFGKANDAPLQARNFRDFVRTVYGSGVLGLL